jgi:hypothetical protein
METFEKLGLAGLVIVSLLLGLFFIQPPEHVPTGEAPYRNYTAEEKAQFGSVAIGEFTHQVLNSSGSVIFTRELKSRVVGNSLPDCDIIDCDYVIEINCSQDVVLSMPDFAGAYDISDATQTSVFHSETEEVAVEVPHYDTVEGFDENGSAITQSIQNGTDTVMENQTIENTTDILCDAGSSHNITIRSHKSSPSTSVDVWDSAYGIQFHDAAWWNASWNYKIAVQVNSTVTSNLTNFPKSISINTSNGTFWNASNCANVRFLNSTEDGLLNFNLNNANSTYCGNATNNATFFAGLNLANSSLGNTTFYIYGGNLGAVSGENAQALYRNASYVGVYHLETNGTQTDKSGYNNLAQNMTYCPQVQMTWGGGINFTGNCNFQNITPSSLPIGDGNATFEIWQNTNNTSGTYEAVLAYGNGGSTNQDREYLVKGATECSSGQKMMFSQYGTMFCSGFSSLGGYFAGIRTGNNAIKLRQNLTDNATNATQVMNTVLGKLSIGSYEMSNISNLTNTSIDEVRIRNVTDTNDWLTALVSATALVGPVVSNTNITAVLGTGINTIDFRPVAASSSNVFAVNESASVPLFNVTSLLGGVQNISMNISPAITGFTVFCANDSAMSAPTTLSASLQNVTPIAGMANIGIWCMANFSNPIPVTQTYNIDVEGR